MVLLFVKLSALSLALIPAWLGTKMEVNSCIPRSEYLNQFLYTQAQQWKSVPLYPGTNMEVNSCIPRHEYASYFWHTQIWIWKSIPAYTGTSMKVTHSSLNLCSDCSHCLCQQPHYYSQKVIHDLPYFSTWTPFTSTHCWYCGIRFLIPVLKKSAASVLILLLTPVAVHSFQTAAMWDPSLCEWTGGNHLVQDNS